MLTRTRSRARAMQSDQLGTPQVLPGSATGSAAHADDSDWQRAWDPASPGYHMHCKHPAALYAGDVWSMTAADVGSSTVGFVGDAYDVKTSSRDDAGQGIAWMTLDEGTTCIRSDFSLDEKEHIATYHLPIPGNEIGEDGYPIYREDWEPYQLSLRIDKESHVPQAQFNEDGVWHDFAPGGAGAALKGEGPWFPYLRLASRDRVVGHCVTRPSKPTKSASSKGGAAAAGGGTGGGSSAAADAAAGGGGGGGGNASEAVAASP